MDEGEAASDAAKPARTRYLIRVTHSSGMLEGKYTADTVFLIEQMSLGSKEIAEFWGGKYRESIEVIVVAGTELALIVDGERAGYPIVDSAALHVEALTNYASGDA